MNKQKLSKTSSAILTFAVIFVVVFGTLSLLNFLGLDAYGSLVAGFVAGVTSLVLKLVLDRPRSQGAES